MSPFHSMEISGFGVRTWVVNGGDLWRSSVRLQVAERYKGRMVLAARLPSGSSLPNEALQRSFILMNSLS